MDTFTFKWLQWSYLSCVLSFYAAACQAAATSWRRGASPEGVVHVSPYGLRGASLLLLASRRQAQPGPGGRPAEGRTCAGRFAPGGRGTDTQDKVAAPFVGFY